MIYQNKLAKIAQWLILGLLVLVALLFLVFPLIHLGYKIQIDYKEDWNVYHSLQAISGQPLYDRSNEWIPLNYPPLLVALFIFIGLFIKHTLLPIPLTITIDLLLASRQKFLKWVICFSLIITLFTAIACALTGIDFLYQLLISRQYNIQKIVDFLIKLPLKMPFMLLMTQL